MLRELQTKQVGAEWPRLLSPYFFLPSGIGMVAVTPTVVLVELPRWVPGIGPPSGPLPGCVYFVVAEGATVAGPTFTAMGGGACWVTTVVWAHTTEAPKAQPRNVMVAFIRLSRSFKSLEDSVMLLRLAS